MGKTKKRSQPSSDASVNSTKLVDSKPCKEEQKCQPVSCDFKVLKWKFEGTDVTYHFFFKKHQGPIAVFSHGDKLKPNGFTILVLNVPYFMKDSHFFKLFSPFGKIQRVVLNQNPTSDAPKPYDPFLPQDVICGFKVAYVVFKDSSSVDEMCSLDTDELAPLELLETNDMGLPSWVKNYNNSIKSSETLKSDVEKFMSNYEKEEKLRKQREAQEAEDEDGWITVSKKSKRGPAAIPLTEKRQEKLKAKKKRFERQIVRFAPTQIKETRAKAIEDMKKKFEEDKQKVAILKQKRKFKPL